MIVGETIHTTEPINNCQTVPRWNDYVKDYVDTLLFWYNMWVENNRPHNGIETD